MQISKKNPDLLPFNSLKKKNSLLIYQELSTNPTLLKKKTFKNSNLQKEQDGKALKTSYIKSDLNAQYNLFENQKIDKSIKSIKNKKNKSISKTASVPNKKLNIKTLKEKAEEFIKQIKTQNNFITQQKNFTNALNGEKFSTLFKNNSTEDSYSTDENQKTKNLINMTKVVNSKQNENLKEINFEGECGIDSMKLLNFSFLNSDVFQENNSNNDSKRLNLLNDFVNEKSQEIKQLNLEVPNQDNFLTLSYMIKTSSIIDSNFNRILAKTDKELKRSFDNAQSNFFETSKINLNRSYMKNINNCLFNQEKDEVIHEYECCFSDCQYSFKNKKDWEKHYQEHL